MKLSKKIYSLLAITFLFLFIFIGSSVKAAAPIDDVRALVNKYYVTPVGQDVLNQPSIDGILSHLDKYSVYFTADAFNQFINGLDNTYVGVGIGLQNTENKVIINEVFPNSSAKQAGIEANDEITAINGASVSGETLSQVIQQMKGPEYSPINITFYRPSTKSSFTRTLTREKINIPTVVSKKLAGNVGYMAIRSFNNYTVSQMQDTMKKFGGVDHWIIDLRNNPGGYVSVARQVVGMFPNIPTTLITKTRYSSQALSSIPQPIKFNKPVDLLVNENSASASEITSGALKDAHDATLYGHTTYGKGVMQSLFQLTNGDYLKLTTAQFFTPNHHVIEHVGIQPDVVTDTPLIAAHDAWFKKKYRAYYQLPGLKNVASDKKFNVGFTTAVDISSFNQSTFELVQLGGNAVPVTFTKTDEKHIRVVPTKPLIKGGSYLLIIHPGWKSANGTSSIKGAMVRFNIEKD